MREKSEITHHRGQIPSGLGRRAGLPVRADSGKFPLAHVVAFQHAILHTVSGGNGFHGVGTGDAPAVSPRTSAHPLYYRRSPIAKTGWCWHKMPRAIYNEAQKSGMAGLTRRRTTNELRLEFIERNNVIYFCNLLVGELMLILDLYL
jgi:hypothetical protein